MGDVCTFESDGRRFEQVGYNLAVLKLGQRGAQYHRELHNQEERCRNGSPAPRLSEATPSKGLFNSVLHPTKSRFGISPR